MKIAILVDELPTSVAPKIVGEEAYHMRALGVRADVIVMKKRSKEAPLAHGRDVKAIYLDRYLGKMNMFFGVRFPTFSFFSLYHIAYPYILKRVSQKILGEYDGVVVHYTSAALLARRLRLRRSIFYLMKVGLNLEKGFSHRLGRASIETSYLALTSLFSHLGFI